MTDLEKSASGASGACGPFVENSDIVRTFWKEKETATSFWVQTTISICIMLVVQGSFMKHTNWVWISYSFGGIFEGMADCKIDKNLKTVEDSIHENAKCLELLGRQLDLALLLAVSVLKLFFSDFKRFSSCWMCSVSDLEFGVGHVPDFKGHYH